MNRPKKDDSLKMENKVLKWASLFLNGNSHDINNKYLDDFNDWDNELCSPIYQ